MEKNKIAKDVVLASCVWKFARNIGKSQGLTFADIMYFMKKFDAYRGLDDEIVRAACSATVDKLIDYEILQGEWQRVDDGFVRVFSVTNVSSGLVQKYYDNMLDTIIENINFDTKEFLSKDFYAVKGEFDNFDLYRNLDKIIDAERFLLIKPKECEPKHSKFRYEITPIGKDCLAKIEKQKEKHEDNFEQLYFGD